MRNLQTIVDDSDFHVVMNDRHRNGIHVSIYDKDVSSLGPIVQETILFKDLKRDDLYTWIPAGPTRERAIKAARSRANTLLRNLRTDPKSARLWNHLSHVDWEFDMSTDTSRYDKGQDQLSDITAYIKECAKENFNRTNLTIYNHPKVPDRYRESLYVQHEATA